MAHPQSSVELPPLCRQFNLPDAFERIDQIDTRSLLDRASANFRRVRDNYLGVHNEFYGGSRDFACTYTQKTHDQLQGQINGVYNDMLNIQAVMYSFLELAFERIEQLENGLSYRGVWRHGERYLRGHMVTANGSVWHCNASTNTRPGTDTDAWTLAVRRGKDGKDAR